MMLSLRFRKSSWNHTIFIILIFLVLAALTPGRGSAGDDPKQNTRLTRRGPSTVGERTTPSGLEITSKSAVTIGDPRYANLRAASALTRADLIIPAGTYTVSSDLSFAAGVNVIIMAGAIIRVTGTGTELYFGGTTTVENGATINLARTCMAIFGKGFIAGDYAVFTGRGAVDGVKFGLGPQLCTDRGFDNPGAWTSLYGKWVVSGSKASTATGGRITNGSVSPVGGGNSQYWVRLQVLAAKAGAVSLKVGNPAVVTPWSTVGWKEDICTANHSGSNYGIWLQDHSGFRGKVDNASVRQVFGGCVDKILPQWWGAVGDGATDCAAAIQDAINAASFGFTPGAPTECPSRYNSRICKLVYLPPGRYSCSTGIYLKPWAMLHGSPQSTEIAAAASFIGNRLLIVDSAYGGFAGGAHRSKHLLLSHLKLDGSLATGDLYLLYVAAPFAGIIMDYVRFQGVPWAWPKSGPNVWGWYIDGPTALNVNDTVLSNFAVMDCNNPQAGIMFKHVAGMQNMVIAGGNFNCDGTCLWLAGSNNLVTRCNFDASPGVNWKVWQRSAGASIPAGALVAGNPTRVNMAHGYTTGAKIYISGITQANWSNVNGLYYVTKVNNKQFTINYDSTGYAKYTDKSGHQEMVGGNVWMIKSYGNHQIWRENYVDGGGYGTELLGLMNQSLNGTSRDIISINNAGMSNRGCFTEMLNDQRRGPPDIKKIAATFIAKDQFSVAAADAGYFRQNNHVWVYQGIAYGWIRSQITSKVRNTITIADKILRRDTTIQIGIEPTNSQKNTNILIQYDGAPVPEG